MFIVSYYLSKYTSILVILCSVVLAFMTPIKFASLLFLTGVTFFMCSLLLKSILISQAIAARHLFPTGEDGTQRMVKLKPDVLKGIIAGLPVDLREYADGSAYVVQPANWFVGLILIPYMNSWFYSSETPVFVYEGSYLDALFAWAFMLKEPTDLGK